MTIEERLNRYYGTFSENEKYVCRCLAGHYRECAGMPAEEFARECGVSQALLVRFAKKLGLSGYSELRARLKLELQEREAPERGLMERVTASYHKMMEDLMKRDFSALFERLEAAGRVFVYGSGSSQARAAGEMKRIFLPAKEMVSLHGHDMCGAIQKIAGPEDMVFLISLSGESAAVVELARGLRLRQVPTVSITRLGSSTLASLCGENLYINSVRMPVGNGAEYEIATPYFILIEFLYLSYQNYRSARAERGALPEKTGVQNFTT